VGKKINVFRENDVEHLKTYLVEMVREIVFSEEEETNQNTKTPEVVADYVKKLVVTAMGAYYGKNPIEGYDPSADLSDATITPKHKGNKQVFFVYVEVPDVESPDPDAPRLREKIWNVITEALTNDSELAKVRVAKGDEIWTLGKTRASWGYTKSALFYLNDQVTVEEGGSAKVGVYLAPKKGTKKKPPNRGEIAEALLAAAVAYRFKNLPATDPEIEGDLNSIPGKATVEKVRQWLQSPEFKGAAKWSDTSVEWTGQIKNPDNGATDTIVMDVQLREFSLKGFMPKLGVLGPWVASADGDPQGKIEKYFQGACNYANREAIAFAIGNIPGEESDEEKLGWFINEFDNTIKIGAIGTDNQKGTKVDVEMTCRPTANCPFGQTDPDDKSLVKLARLSLKGASEMLGHKGATRAEGALEMLTSIFGELDTIYVPNPENPDKLMAVKDETQAAQVIDTFRTEYGKATRTKKVDGRDTASDEYKQLLNGIVLSYFAKADRIINNSSGEQKEKFVEALFDRIRNAAQLETDTGLKLVQFDTATEDFYKQFDFSKISGAGLDIKAERTGTVKDVVYLYFNQIDEEKGTKEELFRVRPLHRTGAPLITIEKGPALKKMAKVIQKTADDELTYARKKKA